MLQAWQTCSRDQLLDQPLPLADSQCYKENDKIILPKTMSSDTQNIIPFICLKNEVTSSKISKFMVVESEQNQSIPTLQLINCSGTTPTSGTTL